jgi:hypothetical protein
MPDWRSWHGRLRSRAWRRTIATSQLCGSTWPSKLNDSSGKHGTNKAVASRSSLAKAPSPRVRANTVPEPSPRTPLPQSGLVQHLFRDAIPAPHKPAGYRTISIVASAAEVRAPRRSFAERFAYWRLQLVAIDHASAPQSPSRFRTRRRRAMTRRLLLQVSTLPPPTEERSTRLSKGTAAKPQTILPSMPEAS